MDPKQLQFYEALGNKGEHLIDDGLITIKTRKMKKLGPLPRLKNQLPYARALAWSGHKPEK